MSFYERSQVVPIFIKHALCLSYPNIVIPSIPHLNYTFSITKNVKRGSERPTFLKTFAIDSCLRTCQQSTVHHSLHSARTSNNRKYRNNSGVAQSNFWCQFYPAKS